MNGYRGQHYRQKISGYGCERALKGITFKEMNYAAHGTKAKQSSGELASKFGAENVYAAKSTIRKYITQEVDGFQVKKLAKVSVVEAEVAKQQDEHFEMSSNNESTQVSCKDSAVVT